MTHPMPTVDEMQSARSLVAEHLDVTPLHRHPGLCDLVGTEVRVKHEDHHLVGAFKVRGGVVLAASLDGATPGLVTASTGNHGQSIAFAGQTRGLAVTVAVPEGANPSKVAAMRALGADVLERGADFDEAREWAMSHAARTGARFVSPIEPELVAGVGTATLELLEQDPDVEVIIVPVGGGSGATAACIATAGRDVEVIAVGAEAAPAARDAWASGALSAATCTTQAEGIATRVPFPDTQAILRDPDMGLADFVLVSDEAMHAAQLAYLTHAHTMTEMAGAAPLAAALALGAERLAGRTVALMCCGANASVEELRRVLSVPA